MQDVVDWPDVEIGGTGAWNHGKMARINSVTGTCTVQYGTAALFTQ